MRPGERDYFDWLGRRFHAGLARLDAGKRPVVVIRQTYNTGLDLVKCLSRPGVARSEAGETCKVATRTEAFAQFAASTRMIEAVLAAFPSVTTIDPTHVFCATETCTTGTGTTLYFRDPTHLTNEGSVFLIERIKGELLAKVGRRP